ncbi:MAG: hypothetical protein RLO50_14355 [Azospirillaceae bacterium]
MSDLLHPDLGHDAEGRAFVAVGGPADLAVRRLFGSLSPDDRMETRSLSLGDCRRRFRRRVLYPVAGIVVGIPLFLVVFGTAGAIARDAFAEEWRELFSVAGLFLAGLLALMALLTPIWLREHAKHVGNCLGRDVIVAVTPDGLRVSDGGELALAGAWPELTLAALGIHRYHHPRSDRDWFLDELSLADAEGREAVLPLAVFADGDAAARAILHHLAEHDRVRRVKM